MEISVDDFEELQRKLNAVTRQRDQADGGFKEVGKQIKQEFNASSLQAAEKELEKIDKELEQERIRYVEARKVFDKQYASILGE